jgi:predicted metalloprotease
MRWKRSRRSTNVEDRRGSRVSVGRGRMPAGFKLGGGATLIIIVIALLLGQDPTQLLNILGGGGGGGVLGSAPPAQSGGTNPANDEQAEFVRAILGDTEDTWGQIFATYSERYQAPTLVLYSDAVQSACGMGTAASGPFYCPADQQVYLDLSFFRDLNRLGAPGDFARAYVIGHEIGHHVQNLIGTERQVREARGRAGSQAEANALSVRLELQADCYAGVWAHHAHKQRQLLEEGDLEEGLNAAAAIGDDRLQKNAGRRVHPDSFTHGSSEQRVHWFRIGLQHGDLKRCDTFAAG